MNCREISEFLADYLDGELPVRRRRRFDEHLRVCAECVAYVQSFKATVELAKSAYDETDAVTDAVPERLVEAILAARARDDEHD